MVRPEIAMLPATQFFEYWAVAFLTLCTALLLGSIFFARMDMDLGLHGLWREVRIAVVASLVQGTGLWFSSSLVPGGFRKQVIPTMIVAFVYWLTHLGEWSGYEIVVILFFQALVWFTGAAVLAGQFKIAAIILIAAAAGLAFIAAVAKSL